MTVTRFAPSPTGRLHVGNIRTALHNWLWAKKHGGCFVLRIDDTDSARSTEAFVDAIRQDLDWLGLDYEGEFRQSGRFALYDARFEALRAADHVYACYETPEELDLRRKILLGRGRPPVYERLPAGQAPPPGRAPHWRFRLDHDVAIAWDDLVRGPQNFEPAKLSDPVVRREDGSWLYLLPSVIDDIDMGVTHVVRGEDHVSNTASQLQMFAALGGSPPAFAHEALLVGSEGKLSKRVGSLGVDAFQEAGIEPIALAAFLARLGTSLPVEPVADIATVVESFDFAHLGRAPAHFDVSELQALNAKIVHRTNYSAVAARLPDGMTPVAWDAVRANLTRVSEAADWWQIIEGPVSAITDPADADYLQQADEVARTIDWTNDPWHALTSALKVKTGRAGKRLFLPLRQALTGRDHGPDMSALLPLIGRDRTLKRLSAQAVFDPR